jgi:hypothetical protein
MDTKSTPEDGLNEEQMSDEVDAVVKVIHSMLFYERHASELLKRHLMALK